MDLEDLYNEARSGVLKLCKGCNRELPLTSFSNTTPRSGDKYGKVNRCKECCSSYHKDWYSKNTEYESKRVRTAYLKKQHGMSDEEAEAHIKTGTVGYCDICSSYEALHIDHCHATGVRRGYLCFKCNAALGLFKDKDILLQRAIAYLIRYRASNG